MPHEPSLSAASTPPEPESNICLKDGERTAKPIIPATGEKVFEHSDYAGDGPDALSLVRSFRSSRVVGALTGAATAGLGQSWSHNHNVILKQDGTPGAAGSSARILFGSGSVRAFSWDTTSNSWKPSNSADSLVANASGLLYRRLDDDSAWQFDAAGKLLTVTQRNGWITRYSYSSAGLLTSVSNRFGRALSFAYNAAGQLASVTTPDGQTISYQYDGTTATARLSTVSYPGGVSKTYLYENSSFPQLVTGLIDEAGNRLATVAYDSQGRATSSGYALGADLYSVSYPASAGAATTVTDPLGTQRSYRYGTAAGKLAVLGADKPSGTGASDAASRVQDANGFVTQESDFAGVNTMYTWDINRRLPLSTTKAAGQPEAQTVSTQWHPSFRLPVLITEAGRSTAYSYDNAGNQLSMTVTDSATGQARSWAWSYVASGSGQGLVDTLTDPKGGVWRYGYDSQGNRISSQNPLGQTTSYGYDAAGRVTSQSEPNGLLSSYAYDARGRLTAQTRGSETSSFSYTASGQLASATLPSGYQVSYRYDAAQRLIGAADNRGASVAYTLDGMGNRVSEQVKDAGGNIALATGRIINSLNRVAAVQGAVGQTTQYGFDANGEAVSATDPLSQTTRQSLDALRRPTTTVFPDNAQANLAWSQLDQITQVTDPKGVPTSYETNAFGEVVKEVSPDIGAMSYQRNASGEVTGVRDAVGNTTTIDRDALGRPIRTIYSADNIATFSYDANQTGYLSRFEDKSGSTAYERDAYGRITAKAQTVNSNPNSPSLFKVSYGYTNGDLTSITYPSGLQVFYRKAAGRITGIDVQAPGHNQPLTPFVSALAYTALNQPKSWHWSNGDAANRAFDADGRMSSNEFASYQFDAASRMTGITQRLWARRTGEDGEHGERDESQQNQRNGQNNHSSARLYQTLLSWSAGYDSRNRLTGLARDGASTSYSYDANSNRLTAIDKITSDTDLDGVFDSDDFTQTTSQALNLDPASNRLLGFTHTITKTQAGKKTHTVTSPVNYTLDANGAMTSDGLRTFEYDASRRLAKVKVMKDGEAASISYLHNALGQRVFKSEPAAQNQEPREDELGTDFVAWLKKNFHWLFARAQASSSLGTAYVYGDAELGEHSLLGEYGNGSAKGKGRTEYIWLPVEGGTSIPVGLYRNGKFFAIHSDHLGTPRLITNEDHKPVWQWAYSAFGDNKPTGILKATHNPKQAVTNQPALLKATTPAEFNLRFPGQYFDEESNLSYNYFRSYCPTCGRYTQPDPIGLDGGWSRYGYVDSDPLGAIDPEGLSGQDPKTIGKPQIEQIGRSGRLGDTIQQIPRMGGGRGAGGPICPPVMTPAGRVLTDHAAKRMSTPPPGRAPMDATEIDAVLDGATNIRKRSFHPEGNTLTIQNKNMPGAPQVVVDEATGVRVITVINPKIKP